MKQPIRVLQIIGIAAAGGVEAVILNYYRHIDREKVQFDFVIHKDSKVDLTDEVTALGGKVYKVTPYYKNPLAFTYEIYKVIREGRYRVIHSNMNTLSAFPLFAAKLAGAPVRILHNHSTASPGETKRNIMKYTLRPFAKLFATEYWACSRLAADWMYGKEIAGFGKVTVINNAIDLSKFSFDAEKREKLRGQLGLGDEYVIGHVGRFMYQKNHEFLLETFARFTEKEKNTRLLLIGDGPLRPATEKKAETLGIADKVKFLGIRSDVCDLYNAMDLFILPSHYEGLPVVGVETQANGLPILVSDKVTEEMKLTDLVRYKKLEDGAESWAEEIEKIKTQASGKRENTTAQMRQAGFDIEEEAGKLVELYEEIEKIGLK